jgi:hypothetical protein
VCVRARARMCVCVCVRARVSERKGEKEKGYVPTPLSVVSAHLRERRLHKYTTLDTVSCERIH